MPHIVLVEKDPFEREYLECKLGTVFTRENLLITSFPNAEGFLLGLGPSLVPDIVIMEHHLHLLDLRDSEEDIDRRHAVLLEKFPEVTQDWNHQEAAERLVRYMRKMGSPVPVIIYTHSERSWIERDVLDDPNVSYCPKKLTTHNLLALIQEKIRAIA